MSEKEKLQEVNKRKSLHRTTVEFNKYDREYFIIWKNKINKAILESRKDKKNSFNIIASEVVMPGIHVVLELRRFFRLRKKIKANVDFDKVYGVVRITVAENS